ncbi:MAG: glycosyltransferase, partial [Ktedonobacterales bacterium]
YGQLSGNVLEYLGSGLHTVNENDPYKRAPEDFPLWKVAEEGRIMAWDSPWGKGFPGWHIECSAMSAKYLGEEIDIHTGGVDNIFPHHEDERAQSEAASGHHFVRHWVHAQHLLADGLKMAKSTGNAYTLADVEARGFEPLALRYFFTTAKYRSRINFTFRALHAAQVALRRLRERAYELHDTAGGKLADATAVRDHPYRQAFIAAVDDDLNLPRAMAVTWAMLCDVTLLPDLRLALLYDFDQILGFDFAADVTRYAERHHMRDAVNGQASQIETDADDVPETVLALARTRAQERAAHNYIAADALRDQIAAAGYDVRDGRSSTRILKHVEQEELISGSGDVPSHVDQPSKYAFSVNLLAHNSRADLERCVTSIARHAGRRSIEIVILDNGSTDDTLAYLKQLHHEGQVQDIPVRVLFADHDMGFGAGRNATFRASLGDVIVLLDTSIELTGDIWTAIQNALSDPTIGIVGPFGLVTLDLKEYEESAGPDVDAVEGYLMAFRRATLLEVGPADEKFRFYRLMDVDYSLEFKKAGYRVIVDDAITQRIIKHPLREWYSLTAEEQATKSKHNFDIYWRRRHHSQSLLVANYQPDQGAPWGHDHTLASPDQIDPRFEHLPYTEAAPHTHEHKHWPDHAHSHPHTHTPGPRWFGGGAAIYAASYAEPATGTYLTASADSVHSGKGDTHGDRR